MGAQNLAQGLYGVSTYMGAVSVAVNMSDGTPGLIVALKSTLQAMSVTPSLLQLG